MPASEFKNSILTSAIITEPDPASGGKLVCA